MEVQLLVKSCDDIQRPCICICSVLASAYE